MRNLIIWFSLSALSLIEWLVSQTLYAYYGFVWAICFAAAVSVCFCILLNSLEEHFAVCFFVWLGVYSLITVLLTSFSPHNGLLEWGFEITSSFAFSVISCIIRYAITVSVVLVFCLIKFLKRITKKGR